MTITQVWLREYAPEPGSSARTQTIRVLPGYEVTEGPHGVTVVTKRAKHLYPWGVISRLDYQ